MVGPNDVYFSVVVTEGIRDVSGDNVVESKEVLLSVDAIIVVENIEVDEYDDGKRVEGMFVVFLVFSSI